MSEDINRTNKRLKAAFAAASGYINSIITPGRHIRLGDLKGFNADLREAIMESDGKNTAQRVEEFLIDQIEQGNLTFENAFYESFSLQDRQKSSDGILTDRIEHRMRPILNPEGPSRENVAFAPQL